MSITISLKKIRGNRPFFDKTSQHLAGAEACLSEDILDDAVALIEYSVEEFGRAVALRERLETGSEESKESSFGVMSTSTIRLGLFCLKN